LLLVGMLPASAIAFFCCCTVVVQLVPTSPPALVPNLEWGLPFGAIGGLVVFGLMLWGGVSLLRRTKQSSL
jgi:hypothetical protein